MATTKPVPFEGTSEAQAKVLLDLFESGDIYSASLVFQPQDPQEVQRRIQMNKLQAQSLDQLLAAGTTESSKDTGWHNRPLGLLGVEWGESDRKKYPGSLPVFAIITAVGYDGEVVTITSGSAGIVFDLALIVAKGWMTVTDGVPDAWVRIVASETSAGNDALNLQAAPAPSKDASGKQF